MIKINTVVCNQLFVIHFLSIVVILSGSKPILESIILFERSLFRHLTETIACRSFHQAGFNQWNIDPLGVASRSTRESKLRKSKKNVLFPFRSEMCVRETAPFCLRKQINDPMGCRAFLSSSSLFFNPTCIEKEKKIEKGNETILISIFVSRKLNF